MNMNREDEKEGDEEVVGTRGGGDRLEEGPSPLPCVHSDSGGPFSLTRPIARVSRCIPIDVPLFVHHVVLGIFLRTNFTPR